MLNRVPDTELPDLPSYDPADLVPLAELAAEGFGHGSPYVKTPKDAIDVLAHQLDGAVTLDDLGRRCVTRDTARQLFTDRAEAEQRQREARERHQAEAAAKPRHHPRGVPAVEGMTAAEQIAQQAAGERGPSVRAQLLDDQLSGRPSAGAKYRIDHSQDES